MDVISLGKATQALNKIKDLDNNIVAPLAESRFPTVDARLDWLEGQAAKIKAQNSKQLDLTKGFFTNTEYVNGKIQLKSTGVNQYVSSGVWESSIIDLGEGWKETKLVDIVKQFHLGEDITPPMTSNTSPSPYNVTASSRFSGYEEWKAFNHNHGASDIWVANGFSGWIQFDFGSPVTISKYAIQARNNVNAIYATPRDWTLKGSNDGANFTVLDSHVLANTPQWSPNERREFILSAPVTYRYYRIDGSVDSKWGAYMAIGEIEFIGPDKSNLILEISTSDDGVSFTSYTTLDPNNPPQGRYIKIRATLSAQAGAGEATNLDFNNQDPQNTFTLDDKLVADGQLKFKTSYTSAMTNEGAVGTGTVLSAVIDKTQFKSIEKVSVN